MKLIRSLFLDDLEAELARTTTKPKLLEFQDKLASLKFLDPACGCGNFLVVAYRELRRLEIEMLEKFHAKKKGEIQQLLNLDELLKVNVDQMHGIEIEEWPARIAEVAMWLVDHQMNTKAGETFGQPVLRLPLTKSAKIVHANALRTDWNEVLPAAECSFVLGNPPFVGGKLQTDDQRSDLESVASDIKGRGLLDFVCGWYLVASKYIRGTRIKVGFVSTNSISQGEQAGVLWEAMFDRGVKIHFAHRTFGWTSEARGKANVHVVIIGFACFDADKKIIYSYESLDGPPIASTAANISPYLVAGPDVAITNRSKPICENPELGIGNKPIDGGHYLFPDNKAVQEFLALEPHAEQFVRKFWGAEDFLNNEPRYCLWLGDASPDAIRQMPQVMSRIAAVKEL
jgi:type II restriction/modification system DNA methylase subunit YeeA